MEKYLYQDLDNLEYKHWWHISKRKTCLKLIQNYCKSNKLQILDIGCGTGQNLKEFSSLGSASGIDNSPQAIKFCLKKGLKKVELKPADKTDFKNGNFNLVTMLDVLEHVEEKQTLTEVNRILTNDGYLLITVPAFNWLWSKWDRVLHHKRRYTKNSLQKTLKNSGFEIIMISYMYSFLVLPILVIRSFKSLLSKKTYSSDFKIYPNIINYTLIKVCDIERLVFNNFFSLPLGTSIVCLAKKTDLIKK